MNISQVKQRCRIDAYLMSLGIEPTHVNSRGIWYHSLLNNADTTPSLQVSVDGRAFHDWSTGDSGNIIDLVISLGYAKDCRGALSVLDKFAGCCGCSHSAAALTASTNYFSLYQQTAYVVERCSKVENPALLRYATSRGISPLTIEKYLLEIHYSFKGNSYYALGWRNASGGFEIRNKYVKLALVRKDITVVGDLVDCPILIFEGYFDFLSAVELGYYNEFEENAIVLNSTSMVSRAINVLRNATHIESWLDNDPAGVFALNKIRDAGYSVTDKSLLYANFKDINEYLMNKSILNKRRKHG